jgi:hypothetical protein
MITKTRLIVARQFASIVALTGMLLATTSARASPVFPGAIQEAAHMPCAPGCLLCHTVSPGTASTWTKQLPLELFATHKIVPGNAASLEAAFAQFAADPNNAAQVTALAQGNDPQTGRSVCGPEYGCSVRFTRLPPATTPVAICLGLALALARSFRRSRVISARSTDRAASARGAGRPPSQS